jgi:hypothetical protein
MFNFAPPRFDALVELIVRRTLCDVAKWRGRPAGGPQGAHTNYVNEGLHRLREILSGRDADSPEVRAAWDEMTANMGAMQKSFAASQRPLEARRSSRIVVSISTAGIPSATRNGPIGIANRELPSTWEKSRSPIAAPARSSSETSSSAPSSQRMKLAIGPACGLRPSPQPGLDVTSLFERVHICLDNG